MILLISPSILLSGYTVFDLEIKLSIVWGLIGIMQVLKDIPLIRRKLDLLLLLKQNKQKQNKKNE